MCTYLHKYHANLPPIRCEKKPRLVLYPSYTNLSHILYKSLCESYTSLLQILNKYWKNLFTNLHANLIQALNKLLTHLRRLLYKSLHNLIHITYILYTYLYRHHSSLLPILCKKKPRLILYTSYTNLIHILYKASCKLYTSLRQTLNKYYTILFANLHATLIQALSKPHTHLKRLFIQISTSTSMRILNKSCANLYTNHKRRLCTAYTILI